MSTIGTTTTSRGTLGTTVETLHTADSGSKEESVVLIFMNVSSGTATVDLFSNGETDEDRLVAQAIPLLTKETLVVKASFAPDDDIRAVASDTDAIVWRKAVRVLA